jgi:acylphosphatase
VHEFENRPIVRVLVHIGGRVQNVGFRNHVLEIAESYAVSGYVRNLREPASVEIDVEGEFQEVERFLDDVLANPPIFAHVERVERKALEPAGAVGFLRAPTE